MKQMRFCGSVSYRNKRFSRLIKAGYPIILFVFKQYLKRIVITKSSMSKVYSLKEIQFLPISLDKAWEFFSNPANLQAITPPSLGFQIISKYSSDTMYAGQIIEYKVKPILNIPLYWMTEITHVSDKKYFVDEQRFGPYSLWHHQHHFEEVAGGVEMTDIVHYKLPFWFLGDIANTILVRKQLKGIFDFRRIKTEELFGKM
jgi:ligand-binding SRPBCC domain-containing protein